MKKIYIAPFVEIEEVEDLCQTGMNANTYNTGLNTPGNDTNIPGGGETPEIGGDKGDEPDEAASKGGMFIWDDEF